MVLVSASDSLSATGSGCSRPLAPGVSTRYRARYRPREPDLSPGGTSNVVFASPPKRPAPASEPVAASRIRARPVLLTYSAAQAGPHLPKNDAETGALPG